MIQTVVQSLVGPLLSKKYVDCEILMGKGRKFNSAVAKNLIRSEDCDRMSPLFDVSTFRDFYAKRDDLVFELFP